MTTWAGLPDAVGNWVFTICWADWVPPDKLLEKLLPADWASTLTATSPTIQAISTHHRWSWHQPARRASALSWAGRDRGAGREVAAGRRSGVVTPMPPWGECAGRGGR